MSIIRSIPWVPLLVRACLHGAHGVRWCNTLESKIDGDTWGVHDVRSSKSMGSYQSCSCIQNHYSDMHIRLRPASMSEDRGYWCYPSLRCWPWWRYSLGDSMGVFVCCGSNLYTISEGMAVLFEVFRLISCLHIYFDLSVYGCPIGLPFRVSKE